MRTASIAKYGRYLVHLFGSAAGLVAVANGQTTLPCQISDYKLLSASSLAVQCSSSFDLTREGRTAAVTLIGTPTTVPFTIAAVRANWLVLIPSAVGFVFDPTKKYSLALTYTAPDPQDPSSMVSSPEPVTTLDLSGNVSLLPYNQSSKSTSFTFTSHTGFRDAAGHLVVEEDPALGNTQPCSVSLENFSQKVVLLGETCYPFSSVQNPDEADPQWVGRIDVKFATLPNNQLIPNALPSGGSVPSQSIFGNTPTIDPKARVSPGKAPSTIDASQLYLNLAYAAGHGTAPGWFLNGKVAPIVTNVQGYSIAPSAAANVGGNKVPGQTYTDTIDLGGIAQRIYQLNTVLPLLSVTPQITFETDKEFDRDNLLGTIDLKYNFAGLYHTQGIQVLKTYYKLTKALPPPKQPQLADVSVPMFGFAFDFHTGIEAGRAIVDKTVKSTSEKSSLVLPAYSICRIDPQIHSILQVWKITSDTTVIGRYLLAMENTILQSKTGALHLDHLQTWRGILTVTGSFTESSASHMGITLSYTNGFAPPTYARVNSVQAGLLIKY